MQDRTPTPGQEGRALITPEDGSAPFYAKIQMADNPTEPGTPYNKESVLMDITCDTIGIQHTSTPNDAFLALALGVGRYGYLIHVQYEDGRPAAGFPISGIVGPNGSAIVTNAEGDAIGVSTEQSVTVNVTSPYINIEDALNVQIQSTGALTPYTVTANRKTGVFSVKTSGTISFSEDVATYDLCAVGGGGAGNGAGQSDNPGSGGGGGYVQNLLGVSRQTYPTLTVAIGAGGTVGTASDDVGNGGITTISASGQQLLSANGGNGAFENKSGVLKPGTGNGDGGSGRYSGNINSTMREAATGNDGTGYIFDESSLGLAGGGGGAGFLGSYNNATAATPAYGGGPNGGYGGTIYLGSGSKLVSTPPGPAGVGGGGGGGYSGISASKGGDGNLYVRCHYTDEVAA